MVFFVFIMVSGQLKTTIIYGVWPAKMFHLECLANIFVVKGKSLLITPEQALAGHVFEEFSLHFSVQLLRIFTLLGTNSR